MKRTEKTTGETESDLGVETTSSPAAELLPAETWRDRKGTPLATFAGVRVLHDWPQGRELTEADYDAAVTKFCTFTIGG